MAFSYYPPLSSAKPNQVIQSPKSTRVQVPAGNERSRRRPYCRSRLTSSCIPFRGVKLPQRTRLLRLPDRTHARSCARRAIAPLPLFMLDSHSAARSSLLGPCPSAQRSRSLDETRTSESGLTYQIGARGLDTLQSSFIGQQTVISANAQPAALPLRQRTFFRVYRHQDFKPDAVTQIH
jgi:hypothetical protein